jgi:predicted permease
MLDDKFEKSLSKLVSNFLLPAFIFCEIIKNLDVNNTSLMIEVIVGNCIIYGSGMLIGFICAKVLGSSSNEASFFCGIMSALHTTSLPVILMEVLQENLDQIKYVNSDGTVTSSRNRGMLYIVLNSIFANIWRWGVSYNMINPEEEDEATREKKDQLLCDDNEKKKPLPKSKSCGEIIIEMINVPIVISILSIVLCYITPVREAFIVPGSLLNKTLLSVNSIISRGYNLMVILILGLNIANLLLEKDDKKKKYKEPEISSWKLGFTTFMKLFVHPLVGTPVLLYLFHTGFMTDGVLVFLYLFMLAAPNAINIIVVCSIKNTREKATAMMIMVQYIVSVVTLTLGIAYFLYILT